jgi:hypothetical protein
MLMAAMMHSNVQALGAADEFVSEAKARLHYPKAIVGKTLLNMLRLIYKNHAQPRDVSAVHKITTSTAIVYTMRHDSSSVSSICYCGC